LPEAVLFVSAIGRNYKPLEKNVQMGDA
jgi:hypothetical protein